MHTPHGALTVVASEVHWVLALCWTFAFLVYEIAEDWRLRDRAYLDVTGYLIGLAALILWRRFAPW